MTSPIAPRGRVQALVLAWACLLPAVLFAAPLRPNVVATRGIPSSISANYGAAVRLTPSGVAGPYAIPTGSGFEIRDAALGGSQPIGSFRTSGVVSALSVDGSTAYLFAGTRGIVAVNITNPAAPSAIGSFDGLGNVTLGAASQNGYGLVAASGSDLHFLARSAPGAISLVSTIHFADAREVRGIVARSDSFLVVCERLNPVPRLFLTLYRLRTSSSLPESLRELQIPLQTPTGLAWVGDFAFIAVGNAGVLVANVPSAVTTDTFGFGKFVRSVDADDSLVVAAAQAGTYAKIRRSGASGQLLVNPTFESLPLEPIHVRLSGSRVVISAQDVASTQEPDEVAQSAIELRDLNVTLSGPDLGGTGRTRRVAWSAGYAYVADYTGGLRIYRAGGADSSLVGALAFGPNTPVVDVALDAAHGRAYLAAGTQGLQIVDVSNPAAPSLLGSLALPGLASAVAVVDSSLVVVGRRGNVGAGVTFVDVTAPSLPAARGQMGNPVVDPRALAVKDTVAYVADASVGLLSIGFGNPDAPTLIGTFSGVPARDLDRSGDLLLIAASSGLQVVDIFRAASPVLASQVVVPPLQGVAHSGNSAVLFAGDQGALVVDLANPSSPQLRGPIGVAGSSRDGAWIGDTLLIATGLVLERYGVSPVATTVPALTVQYDAGLVTPRADIQWSAVSLPGLVGLNLYRDLMPVQPGTTDPTGTRINDALLPANATGTTDGSLAPGATYRYRLEAFFADGSETKVAEGSLFVPSTGDVGRAYPNPYTPRTGLLLTIPFRVIAGTGGSIDVTVHDVSGRLVYRTAVAAPAGGGFGSVSWDGRDARGHAAATGVYFVRIQGLGIDDARQIVLVR